MSTPKTTTAQMILALRRQLKLSQSEAAKVVGFSKATYGKVEHGYIMPSETITAIYHRLKQYHDQVKSLTPNP